MKKHLHMRGANQKIAALLAAKEETSPHAWSKLLSVVIALVISGNISTCVEQTTGVDNAKALKEKHLHMRGANKTTVKASTLFMETSPHAWSKP